MNITRAAIEKNRVTFVAVIVIIFAGLFTFRNMPRAEDPGFIIRTAMVLTHFPGASPERVEQLVTDKLEKAIQEMPEIDFISSQSRAGVSLIYVNIQERYMNIRPIWDKLRRKVDAVKPGLPADVIPPIVNDEFGDVFGTIISITGEGYSYAELKEVADQVRDELLLLEEIAKVDIYGDQDERVFVEYNNARLAEIGISAFQLKSMLESSNIIIPGGSISTGHERIVLEPSGNFESVEDLRRMVIQIPGRRELLYLEDIADITRGYIDPPSTKMRSSGIPCIGLAISLREGGNLILLGEEVQNKVRELQQIYPIGVEFDIVSFQPEVVDKKVDDFTRSLIQAIIIVFIVLLITLGIRTGLTVSTLIPVTMLMSLFVMAQFNIGLDQMSLASLIIALGMLVDNAIVMSESIMVMINEGKTHLEAAVKSARELRIPLLTSSLTTAAAFLPIYLAESTVGEYTAPLFKVVTITLLCSWILSLTMIPLLCYKFLKASSKHGKPAFNGKFYALYRTFLLTILKHPVKSMCGIILIFLIAMQGFAFIPNIFFPAKDETKFLATLKLPIGTPIERTEEVTGQIDAYLRNTLQVGAENPEGVTNWATFIGESAPRFYLGYNPVLASPELSVMLINVTSLDIIDECIQSLDAYCAQNFPDLKATVKALTNGPPVAAPVAIRISGKDTDIIFDIAESVKAQLEKIPGTKTIDDNWGVRTKKLLVKVNQPRARRAGISSQDVAVSLQTNLSGFEITQYREDDKVIPVTLRSVEADRKDIGKLESLNIYSMTTGRSVPLKQVADIEISWQPSQILRRDRLKTVTVQSELQPGYTAAEVVQNLLPWLESAQNNWELGYSYMIGGDIEESAKSEKAINDKLPIALLIIILLLVGQFNSLRRPIIILLTIPLGLIGVVVGLLLLKGVMGFMTFLGVIALIGIVINNAIVLLERIKLEIEEVGLSPQRAIIEASQRRLRPILLTTVTTIGGLLPLYLGGGSMWESMAIAILFGLLFATVLTLGVVPILYALFFRVKFKNFEYKRPA